MQILTTEERLAKLRQAALELVGVPSDDHGELLQMLTVLHQHSDDEDAVAAMKLLVALIETHPSKG